MKSVGDQLAQARAELIDTSNRSRLLNSRLDGRGNQLRVVRERSGEVFRRLVGDGSYFNFRAAAQASDAAAPIDEAATADGWLETMLEADALEKRLLRLAYEDRTTREEQGISSLHLALGFLRWLDPEAQSVARYAPLVLVPVTLERTSARSGFRLRATGDELPSNLSLASKLRRDFAIELPELPGDLDDAEDPAAALAAHFDAVRDAIAVRAGWTVERDEILLGFFSFAKFLMYRDLDARTWPAELPPARRPDGHPLVAGLLGRSFPPGPGPLCDEDAPLDPLLPPADTLHVVDADASQAQVVAEAIGRRRSLVVQGPPGTGKSQTISNVIAAAVAKGLRVLFVAEKLAALSVVRTRLDAVGLGAACLELHSTKATRRSVLEELARTMELGSPRVGDSASVAERLRGVRDELDGVRERLHRRDPQSGRTAYEVLAELATYAQAGTLAAPELVAAELWNETDLAERVRAVESLAAAARAAGDLRAHPWRGVGLESFLPSDRPRLDAAVRDVRDALRSLDEARVWIEPIVGAESATPTALRAGLAALALASERPPCDRAALANEVWERATAQIETLVADLAKARAERARLTSLVVESAFSEDLVGVRADLAATGRAWLRFLMPRWRRANRRFRSVLRSDRAMPLDERLALLDAIEALRTLERSLTTRDELGRDAFGKAWLGLETDPMAVGTVTRWLGQADANGASVALVRSLASRMESIETFGNEARRRGEACARAAGVLEGALAALQPDLRRAFGVESSGDIRLESLASRVAEWERESGRLREWIDWSSRARDVRALGAGAIAEEIASGSLAPDGAVTALRAARAVALLRRLDMDGSLARFDGAEYARRADEFRRLDEERIRLARAEVAAAHHRHVPRPTEGLGQVAIILRECAKQRRHLPIRRLLGDAGEAVQAIKPVLMMSPLSVARYLEPGRLQFEVLVVDEASQVRPIEALGAVARLAPDATLIVVGDEHQLPPTAFFTRDGSDDEVDGDEEADEAIGDLESLLGACEAAGVPRRMLRWHYRSRHHSLIALSNRLFYDNRLFVLPSPSPPDESLGLKFHRVTGTYDRGGTRANAIEAAAVADAVMAHARTTPDRSLGVAAFSVQQRDAIIDEIELRRRAYPSLEEFFDEGGIEPFFVKNLENVQGDERDVIFISVGYGRDAGGSMHMNFGPVSAEGGERRLNVLVTRAKSRCEVFSSIGASDIDLSRATGEGPHALRAFLAYAETGELAAAGAARERERGDQLARSIGAAIVAAGHAVEYSVGVAGFFVDLAVRDPSHTDAFILGIETDGSGWETTRTVRDRERTRPGVLAARGWRIVRVHAADWYARREDRLRELLKAVEDAVSHRASAPGAARPDEVTPSIERDRAEAPRPLTEPYRVADLPVPRKRKPTELDERALAELVGKVLEIEAPMHVAELTRRIASLFRSSRVSPALSEAVSVAVRRLASAGFVVADGEFLSLGSRPSPPLRDRRDAPASVRDTAMLPTAEIAALMTEIARVQIGATRDEIVVEARRQLGYATTTIRIREAMERGLARALGDGRIVERDGALFVPRDA